MAKATTKSFSLLRDAIRSPTKGQIIVCVTLELIILFGTFNCLLNFIVTSKILASSRKYFYYRYSGLMPVWAQTRAQSSDWYGSGTLHPGQILRGSLPLLSPHHISIMLQNVLGSVCSFSENPTPLSNAPVLQNWLLGWSDDIYVQKELYIHVKVHRNRLLFK
jgi:hypothetical protein